MANIFWDAQGEHTYFTGIDGVALFVWDNDVFESDYDHDIVPWYGKGAAWSGVTAINESPSGAESNKLYADNIEYLNLLSKEEFGLTLECYQVPEVFDECDGISAVGALRAHGQVRKQFCLIYRIQEGTDTDPAGATDKDYVYHIVYGCKASPSSRDFATVNDSPEAQTFSYEINTTELSGNNWFIDYGGDTPREITTLTGDVVSSCVHLELHAKNVDENFDFGDILAVLYNTADYSGDHLRAPTPIELVTACEAAV
jgi:hypothetical protein